MKHYITDEDINRVSIKNLLYHDENTCKGIEAYCQYLLDCSKCYNNSNECGMLLDVQDLSKYNLYKGNEHNVTAKINWASLRMKYEEFENRFIFVHNHPNNSWFSELDLKTFLSNPYLYLAIVVQNNGICHILMKQSNSPINTSKVLDYMKELTIKEKIHTLKQVDIFYYRRYSK